MSILEQTEIQSKIAQIIERSRHHEEQFLIDSRTAASDIIQFLKKKNLIEGFFDERNSPLQN